MSFRSFSCALTVVADPDPTTLPRIAAAIGLFNLIPASLSVTVDRNMTISMELREASDAQLDLLVRKLMQMSSVRSVSD